MESGATDHLTNDVSKLGNVVAYSGNDGFYVGNGNVVNIHHT